MKLKVIASAFTVLAILGSYFAYSKYVDYKFIESITPHVKNSSLRISNEIRSLLDDGSKMTYKESFEKLEADISEIDKKILEIQSVTNSEAQNKTEPVLNYLKGGQEMLRAMLNMHRKKMAYQSAIESSRDAFINMLNVTDSYELKYASKRSTEAMTAMEKAGEELTKANSDFLETSKHMSGLLSKVSLIIVGDALVNEADFKSVIKKFEYKEDKK